MAIIITSYVKKGIVIISGFLAFILFFTNAENTKIAINESFYFCFNSLIPSIFIFMILSSFLLYSSVFSGILNTINEKVFSKLGICRKYFLHILLCSFCGFVNGPKAICEEYKKSGGDETDFSNAVILSSNAGFGFLVGCVGQRIWGDAMLGIFLFLFQILSSFVLGKFILKHNLVTDTSLVKEQAPPSLSSAFSNAVISSSFTMISICAFVVVFSCLITVGLGAIGIASGTPLYAFISLLCEFCKGSFLVRNFKILPLCAFFSGFCVGFGGLCVHFQTFSVCEGLPLDKKRFVAFKLLHGLVCGCFTLIYVLVREFF